MEVKALIDKLNKATRLDEIVPKIVNLCSDMLTVPLASLINKCISMGVFPDKLKNAFVLPIHKKGQSNDVNKYKPISILPIISKLLKDF